MLPKNKIDLIGGNAYIAAVKTSSLKDFLDIQVAKYKQSSFIAAHVGVLHRAKQIVFDKCLYLLVKNKG